MLECSVANPPPRRHAIMLVPAVLAATWPAAAVAGAHARNGHIQQHTSNSQLPQCPGQLLPNCGLTDGDHIYNTTAASDYSACCEICATDPQNCTAWVFVADGVVWNKGPGQCKLRHSMASCRPELLNHVSGSLQQPTNYTCDGSACVPDPGGEYTDSNCAGQCGRPPPSPVPPSPPTPPAAGRKPHILLLVVDDWGWSNVGFHRQNISAGGSSGSVSSDDVVTPNFDALVRNGLELDRNYVHKFCSPTRSSIQSGRLPVHVNLVNADPQISNAKDPISGWAGIPRNMTTIAQLLKRAGYRTHLVGKWDCGMATPEHTPRGRGYDSSFGYFHHANDYWTEAIGWCPADPEDPEVRRSNACFVVGAISL